MNEIIYIGSFFIGLVSLIITILATFRKRTFCSIDYLTEYGDETNLYIFSVKDELTSLKIICSDSRINATKYQRPRISELKHNRDNKVNGDSSLYHPWLEKGEIIEIKGASDLGEIRFEYEDKYSNKYFQLIQFDYNSNRDFHSRRYYNISKRIATPFWKRLV